MKILRDSIEDESIENLVQHHLRIIRLTNHLNRIFWPIILAEFVVIAFILCVVGVQVMLSNNYLKILGAAIHMLTCLVDVSTYAYAGQKVLDSGLAVANQLYKTDRGYIPIIIMSQKELKFDTGLFSASLDTLSVVLSRTMSLITLVESYY